MLLMLLLLLAPLLLLVSLLLLSFLRLLVLILFLNLTGVSTASLLLLRSAVAGVPDVVNIPLLASLILLAPC